MNAIHWVAVEAGARAGTVPLQQLAAQYSVSRAAIYKRAKQAGWARGVRLAANRQGPGAGGEWGGGHARHRGAAAPAGPAAEPRIGAAAAGRGGLTPRS